MSNLTPPDRDQLPTWRLNLMRAGYLIMGVGLAIYRWPLLPGSASLPVTEGLIVAILTGMSLLAFLGLRYPIAMLPILLFEVLWKVIWLAAVALPHLIASDIDAATESKLFSVLVFIPIIALTPWDYVFKRFVLARGDNWVRSSSRVGAGS